jgi:hypothetical protein
VPVQTCDDLAAAREAASMGAVVILRYRLPRTRTSLIEVIGGGWAYGRAGMFVH